MWHRCMYFHLLTTGVYYVVRNYILRYLTSWMSSVVFLLHNDTHSIQWYLLPSIFEPSHRASGITLQNNRYFLWMQSWKYMLHSTAELHFSKVCHKSIRPKLHNCMYAARYIKWEECDKNSRTCLIFQPTALSALMLFSENLMSEYVSKINSTLAAFKKSPLDCAML